MKRASVHRRRVRPGRRALASLAAGVCVLALAACGSSSSKSSNSGGSGASASPGFKEAAALAKKYSHAPTSIGVTTPVGKKIPTGKHIVLVGAGPAGLATNASYAGFQAAATELGWTTTIVQPQQLTPQDLQQAMAQAIRDKPDAVITSAVDATSFGTGMQQLKAMHVPVVATLAPPQPTNLVSAQIEGPSAEARLAAAEADQILADMGKPGKIGLVGLGGYPLPKEYLVGFYSEVHRLCPTCTIKEVVVPLQDLGTNDGQDIVNFARSNPDLKGLMVGYDGMDSDLFSAAKSAGITLPKVYSLGTLPTSIENLHTGALYSSSPIDYADVGWRAADALARIFTGQRRTLSADAQLEQPTLWSEAYGNVPPVPKGDTFPAVVSGYQQQYEKLWGK